MNYYYNPPRGSRARKALEGGSLLGILGKLYARTVGRWGKKRITDLKDQKKEIKTLEAAVKAKNQKQNQNGAGFDLFEIIDNLGRKESYGGHRQGKVKAKGGCAACKRYFASKEKGGSHMMVHPGWLRRRRELELWGEDPKKNPPPLSTYQGGKLEGRDVVDFLAGPIGWAFMGVRKSREKKIANLKKQLNGGMIGYDAKVNLPLESPVLSVYKQPPKLSLALDGYR